jgi:hypothetical protein
VQVEFRDTGDLKRLNKALRQHADGKQIRSEASKAMKGVLQPLVPRVQAAYRGAPSRGRQRRRGGPGLRSLLAKATRTEVRFSGRQAGARIRVDGRRMPDQMKALPRYWEGEKPRWRHPLFGDRDRWYDQPARPVFRRTVEPSEAAARAEINRILDQVKRKLERAV